MDGKIQLNPLYVFHEEGEQSGKVKGALRKTDNVLQNVDKCIKEGVML